LGHKQEDGGGIKRRLRTGDRRTGDRRTSSG
jgi:hypothetical protein